MSVLSPVNRVEPPLGVATPPGTVVAWDLPTRLFKWGLVLLIIDAYVSNRYMVDYPRWHKLNGYAILVLVTFRVLWGVFGSSTALFARFVRPLQVLPYAMQMFRIPGRHYLGHNPIGGLSVLLLLGIPLAMAVLGLFAADPDRLYIVGPFAELVSEKTSSWATRWHRTTFNLILAITAIHLSAILFYLFVKRQPLLGAMITGLKPAAHYEDEQMIHPARPGAAIACFVAALVLVLGGLRLFGIAPFS